MTWDKSELSTIIEKLVDERLTEIYGERMHEIDDSPSLPPDNDIYIESLNEAIDSIDDVIDHPKHYKSPARCSTCEENIECIDVVEHIGFSLGNAIKYIWRVDAKGDPIVNLEKAIWYIRREIARRRKAETQSP